MVLMNSSIDIDKCRTLSNSDTNGVNGFLSTSFKDTYFVKQKLICSLEALAMSLPLKMKAPTTLSALSPPSFTNVGVPRSKRRAARNGPMKKFERTGCTNSLYTAWKWPHLYVDYDSFDIDSTHSLLS